LRERIAVWGMSLGGGLALTTAAADARIAATIALVPVADGRAPSRSRHGVVPLPAIEELDFLHRYLRTPRTQ
jgi:cephalosporin-C deacetylase-like acetyl esterase